MEIEMVDLKGQYAKIKDEVDTVVLSTIQQSRFINGPAVAEFSQALSTYLDDSFVVTCGNGTDALQIALMALELQPGDEVIIPAFTYVATAEVIGLLNLKPVMVDVDPKTFNISIENVEKAITSKTKAIVPVHLFGQCADMELIMNLANEHGLFVIEDTAQAIGADYIFTNGIKRKAGTIGHIGCTSFFPSKNLGCFGDGGAIFTNNKALAERIRMIANHGQIEKYVHKFIGVNSRLDTIQASVLNIKLRYLNEYSDLRRNAADLYDHLLSEVDGIITPVRSPKSTHVFHQYTLRVLNNRRDSLKSFLESFGIPSMVYYPIPLNEQEAFRGIGSVVGSLNVTSNLCKTVLSLPMHTELNNEKQNFIANKIKEYFK